MAKNYQINVLLSGTTLTVETHTQVLESDDEATPGVVWIFEDIDAYLSQGYMPAIKFLGSDDGSKKYYGPFADLCQTRYMVIGAGNTGDMNTSFEYQAMLVPPEGVSGNVIASDLADPPELVNLISTSDSSPVIDVTVLNDTEYGLELEPEYVNLTAGQSILWRVGWKDSALKPAEWYPQVVFDALEDSESSFEPFRAFGPFASLSTSGGVVLGSGNNDVEGRYKYRFQIVDPASDTVKWRSTPDPAIDNEGNPTGGGTLIKPGFKGEGFRRRQEEFENAGRTRGRRNRGS